MAQYKVPQDVEADDKLLGPFTFRQFIYLMVAGGCIGVAFALFQIFPLLAILPIPLVLFFGALALPLKKDQPMETYFAAIISYHLKPKNRLWLPGQRETIVEITAPKQIEQPLARNITGEEAGNRLSFLANVIDTEGYAIRGGLSNTPIKEEFVAEANAQTDILDEYSSPVINQMIINEQNARKAALVNQMRTAMNSTGVMPSTPTPQSQPTSIFQSTNIQMGEIGANQFSSDRIARQNPFMAPASNQPAVSPPVNQETAAKLQNLANNTDYSIQTIQNEAGRLNIQR